MRHSLGLMVMCAALFTGAFMPGEGAAQKPGSDTVPIRTGVKFTGLVANTTTTRPVTSADIRLMWVDSTHTETGSAPGASPEFFVDSTRSRVAITNDAGTFTLENVVSGHYVLHVRRIGFAPVEAVISVGVSPLEMEVAMEQVMALLPEVRITENATDHVAQRLDRVGYNMRYRSGSSGTFIDRKEILHRKPQYITDVLRAYGVHTDANFTMDKMDTDWETLDHYPAELVIGIEIYRRRGSMATAFDATRAGGLAFGSSASKVNPRSFDKGGTAGWTVLIWTYIP
ncbi:MAG: hypothetical protein JWM95_2235 [Gemmatimonadetes bacterium]|nr:hypothetical protein [Gemmatimonadota bacterium]